MAIPAFLRRFIQWLRGSFAPPPGSPSPQPPPIPDDRLPGRGAPEPVTRMVSLIIFNPIIPGERGRRLSEVLGWNDPDQLAAALVSDLQDVSHGYANFTIAERILVDEFPIKEDRFRYTPASFLQSWQSKSGFHQPDAVDYRQILTQHSLVQKVNDGVIDEVWTISFPYAGFYESRMAGPGAFWCNAPPLDGIDRAGRRFVIMAFNYERGVGEMLESFGHRAESILAQVYRGVPEKENLWKQYTLYDQIAPGRAQVGNVHFAPNSRRDYDWGNRSPVLSCCRNWRVFPDLSGDPVMVNCLEWGGGDIRAHHRWWFTLMPHITGQHKGIANNWWEYILDPNLVD